MSAKLTDNLMSLYAKSIERQSEESRIRARTYHRECALKLQRLAKKGIVIVADLISRLHQLSSREKNFVIYVIPTLKIQQAVSLLLDLLQDPAFRVSAAVALSQLRPVKKVTQVFVDVGRRELQSANPDRLWLEAVIHGIGHSDDPRATEIMLNIFEREDLPGWLRGDAGDKLGCCGRASDRRTTVFRRCLAAVLKGLDDSSIDVQFWSMYVMMQLATYIWYRQSGTATEFKSALPRLREIAAHDHRLAPGFWWPMAAEAQDAIDCIKMGQPAGPDAGERWEGNPERGATTRD